MGGSDEPISADITDDDLQVYYDDDEDFVEKPDELKSKAELKAEAKQRAKEEKEFIKSLPRNQRRMARAELKRKHKEEAEAAKKREEEREQMIQEAIKHRLEKAERVKAAQVRAHLTALERQRVLELFLFLNRHSLRLLILDNRLLGGLKPLWTSFWTSLPIPLLPSRCWMQRSRRKILRQSVLTLN